MYLKPAEGMRVPDPDLRDFLPAEGRRVIPSQYWTRRLLDKDVEAFEPASGADAEPSADAPALPAPTTDEHQEAGQ